MDSKFYKPLRQNKSEIRLLTLERAEHGQHADPLRARLERVKLSDAKYVALSYVWGEHKRGRGQITLSYENSLRDIWRTRKDDYAELRTPSIGFSLDSALRDLRAKYGSITIWTDALCINQDDNDPAQEKPGRLA